MIFLVKFQLIFYINLYLFFFPLESYEKIKETIPSVKAAQSSKAKSIDKDLKSAGYLVNLAEGHSSFCHQMVFGCWILRSCTEAYTMIVIELSY